MLSNAELLTVLVCADQLAVRAAPVRDGLGADTPASGAARAAKKALTPSATRCTLLESTRSCRRPEGRSAGRKGP